MPRTRTQKKSSKLTASVTRVNYKESSDSSDDDNGGAGLLTNILGLFMNMQQWSPQKNRRNSSRRAPKRKPSSAGDCDCDNCAKKRCTGRKARTKGKANGKAKSQSATINEDSVNLESDDEEIAGTNITETHMDSIKNKVDTFFKALDSDADELESKMNIKPSLPKPAEKRNKDFYTLLSDSEDEIKQPSTSASTTTACTTTSSPLSIPSTSGLASTINSGLKMYSMAHNKVPEDLFTYVDDILNDCNVVDIASDKSKETVSLEDLKKKTDEILGGLTSLIDDLKPKPKEPENPKEPEKEAPTCPVCLEILGGSIQAMATFCGHMFCKPCIDQVAKTSKKCPTCRKAVTKTKYHPVYI